MKTPLTFTAAGPVYGFAPGVKACDIEDQLYARQAQLKGLLAMSYGEGGEAFRGMAHDLQNGFMRACSMIAHEVQELTKVIQECREAEGGQS